MTKQELLQRKARLEAELSDLKAKLTHIERMRKPYEAVVYHWCSNRSSTFWPTEEAARRKMDEYYRKQYYLNGRVDRVQLVRYNEDGTFDILVNKEVLAGEQRK